MKFFLKGIVVLSLGVLLVGTISAAPAIANWQVNSRGHTTTTPITHLVVIFQENVSFDHYFGTYPYAQNTPGEPQFKASQDTPAHFYGEWICGLWLNSQEYRWQHSHRLHPAPRAVSVLPVHFQSTPLAAHFDSDDRKNRPGQPPV